MNMEGPIVWDISMALRTQGPWVASLSLWGALEHREILMPGCRDGQGGY